MKEHNGGDVVHMKLLEKWRSSCNMKEKSWGQSLLGRKNMWGGKELLQVFEELLTRMEYILFGHIGL